jgi:peptide chain release factor 2
MHGKTQATVLVRRRNLLGWLVWIILQSGGMNGLRRIGCRCIIPRGVVSAFAAPVVVRRRIPRRWSSTSRPDTDLIQGEGEYSSVSRSTSEKSVKLSFESQLLEVKRRFEAAKQLHQQNLQSSIPLPTLQQRLRDLEMEQAQEDFWVDAARAAVVHSQWSDCTRQVQRQQSWQEWIGEAQAALEILQELAQTDAAPERDLIWQECLLAVQSLETDGRAAELEFLLSGPYDDCPARLVLTAGAGGIEAMDWVADLTRMYTRYCEQQKGWTVQKLDWSDSFSGFKSMELLVTGPKAYGWLQGEKGSHRLVRISPYNAMNKRQTTFAGVDVTPELPPATLEKMGDIVIPETELEVTTMRSSGKGGQHVNKVSSGVRMKHLPSGITVRCTEERSQLANRNIALHRLKAQLLVIAQEQRVQEIRDIRGDIVEASWGTQIRSYVLQPYRQVKDTRTGWETTQTQAILDGSEVLDDCIATYLRYKAEKDREEAEDADANS